MREVVTHLDVERRFVRATEVLTRPLDGGLGIGPSLCQHLQPGGTLGGIGHGFAEEEFLHFQGVAHQGQLIDALPEFFLLLAGRL